MHVRHAFKSYKNGRPVLWYCGDIALDTCLSDIRWLVHLQHPLSTFRHTSNSFKAFHSQ